MDCTRSEPRLSLACLPTVLFVSAVAHSKGGAETVLLDMLASPWLRAALAVPGEGDLADRARALGVPVGLFDLGAVGAIRRPLRARDALRAARDAVRLARRLAALARDMRADLVQTNGLKVHIAGCLARMLDGTPTIVHMHDVAYTRAEQLIWGGLARAAMHTVMASDLCYPAAHRQPGRFSLVMQGVQASPDAKPRTLPARPTIALLGRFHRFKGVHLLLDWFEAAMEAFPTTDLLLRGRPGEEGAAYWAGLQPQIGRLVAAGRCRVEDWRPAHENPFEGVDLLVAPSSTPEVGPRVVMEAMAQGIPAIGYPAGGILRMITRPELGALAANEAEFRAGLARLLQPEAYAAASEAALTHARVEFGLHRFWRDLSHAHAAALESAAAIG